MEFADDTFDGVYAMDATCHAKQPVDVYSEVSVYVCVCVCKE